MAFSLFKGKTPKIKLTKREGGPPRLADLPAEERRAVIWFDWLGVKPMMFFFWGYMVLMPVAYCLAVFWPPYHHSFVVTDWIAGHLPHDIFGVLTVTEAHLDAAGAMLPRGAYIQYAVEQILIVTIFLGWLLLNCHRYWRLYPYYQAYQVRKYSNYNEYMTPIGWKKRSFALLACLAITLSFFWIAASPETLPTLIARANESPHFAVQTALAMWTGMAGLTIMFSFTGITNLRSIVTKFYLDSKPKN